ncbi:MAG: thioesterase, partial [Actinomycetota bacterium]|nr:thioesterase [Actinomycetota bacterium]
LDSVARYLQDVAMDDVDQTGWGSPKHLWVMRHIRIEVVSPPVDDDYVALSTWCSGTAGVAAGRRMSLVGDRGGRIELDSVWVHLGPDTRPTRLVGFETYAAAADGRVVSTKLELPEPPPGGRGTTWTFRLTDIDLLGHVNNAAYWDPIEELLSTRGPDPRRPFRARLEHRHAIDPEDEVELVSDLHDDRLAVALTVGTAARAVALIEQT